MVTCSAVTSWKWIQIFNNLMTQHNFQLWCPVPLVAVADINYGNSGKPIFGLSCQFIHFKVYLNHGFYCRIPDTHLQCTYGKNISDGWGTPLYRSHSEMKQTLLKQIICILLCLYAVPSSLELTHLMKPVTLLQRLNLNWKQNQLVLETEILPLSSIFYLHCVSQVSCKISRKQVEKFETQFCFVLFICNNVSAP